MGITINKPTLRDVRNAGDFATTFRWNLDITEPPRFWSSIYDVQSYKNQLNALCESSGTPTKSVDNMTIAVRGHKHYQPGRVTPAGSLSLTFYETVRNQINSLFTNWQQVIYSHNVGVGLPYDDIIAESITLSRLNARDEPICNYVLLWCFIEGYNSPDLTGSDSGPQKPSVTISYNDFYITDPSGYTPLSKITSYMNYPGYAPNWNRR